jgi:hypothetical protein
VVCLGFDYPELNASLRIYALQSAYMRWRDPQIDGELLKLQTPNSISKEWGGQVNSLGYGKRTEDVTMDNPQPRP